MAYWALEALDGSKTALSSLDRVEGTDPPAYKIGRRPHEESHFGTLPICVSRNQAQLTPCHDGVALRHCGSAPTGVLRHHGAFDSNEDVGQWVWLPPRAPPPRAPPPHPSRLASQPQATRLAWPRSRLNVCRLPRERSGFFTFTPPSPPHHRHLPTYCGALWGGQNRTYLPIA